MATRRSVPAQQMEAPGPDSVALAAMLTIAARVPDHGKLAPWRFVVFEGEAREHVGRRFAEIARVSDDPARERAERERFLRAPTVVAVVSLAAPHPKIPEWEQVLSAGAVCLNLLHAASAHGFSAQWLTEWVAYDATARAAMGLAEHERVAGIIYIGVPTMAPSERARPDLSQIVTRFEVPADVG